MEVVSNSAGLSEVLLWLLTGCWSDVGLLAGSQTRLILCWSLSELNWIYSSFQLIPSSIPFHHIASCGTYKIATRLLQLIESELELKTDRPTHQLQPINQTPQVRRWMSCWSLVCLPRPIILPRLYARYIRNALNQSSGSIRLAIRYRFR